MVGGGAAAGGLGAWQGGGVGGGGGGGVRGAGEDAGRGLFTMDGTGVGQGAILNQDNAVNAAERPAARGSVVQIFATGDGSVPGASVTIGGIGAPVIFAAVTVPGLFQVNAVVPEGGASGAAGPGAPAGGGGLGGEGG